MKKIILFALLFLVLLFGGLFGYKLYALNSMYADDVILKDFSVGGNLQIHITLEFDVINPSLLTNTINEITYEAYLVDYDQVLLLGTLDGAVVPAGESIAFVVDDDLDWTPDIETGLDMLKKEKIEVKFTTVTAVDFLGSELKGENIATIDIAKYVKPAIQKQVDRFSNMFAGLLG